MRIKRWIPEKDIDIFKSSIKNFVGSVLDSAFDWGDLGSTAFPPIDVIEEPDMFVAKLDLPGFTKEDIKITLEDNILTISGERKSEKEYKDKNVLRAERFYGLFSRTITLPAVVDVSKIKAEHKNGILTLTLPKKETAKARTIEIQVD